MHPEVSEARAAVSILFIALIPCAIAGLALSNTGLGRARSAAHGMAAPLCAVATAAIVFFCVGFALQSDAPFAALHFAGRSWNLAGAGPLFLHGLEAGNDRSSTMAMSIAMFQMFSVALAALIPLGAGADRWRLPATCFSTALLAGLTFPLFSHWAQGSGWLAQLGENYGLGRGFVDGGCGATQTVGGLTALAMAWILGPRRGKYGKQGRSLAIPGHDAVLMLCGSFLTWIGWLGLNAAGAMLLAGTNPVRTALTSINTTLAAAFACLAAATLTKIRFGRPDASLIANAWLCGLVSSGAGCAFVAPAAAAATGLVAGVLVVFSVEFLESRLFVDDPAGAISVHACGGIWGLLAAGLFLGKGQWLAQVIGIGILIGLILPLTYSLNALLNRFYPQRVSAAAELQGLDLHELGAGAYPEFVIHSEDITNRLR